MNNEIYEQLANALDKLPNGFPRTPSNVEIPLLKKIFSPEEASLASQLHGEMETIDVIAQRVGLPVEEAKTKLMEMGVRGLSPIVGILRGTGVRQKSTTPREAYGNLTPQIDYRNNN